SGTRRSGQRGWNRWRSRRGDSSYARREPIDLIVVGTHGHTGVSRLILGSVAERVVRGARCPVLVVPARRPSLGAMPASPVGVGGDDDERVGQLRPCLVCGAGTRDLICGPCRAHSGRGTGAQAPRGTRGPIMTHGPISRAAAVLGCA